MSTRSAAVAASSGLVLLTLGAGQFLMTLDSSVMNVSMATVAEDLGTSITGIQTAITMYTLVMASLMITGGKIGSNIGRRNAFAIGCVIYAIGSFITGLSQNLTTLLIGWSLLEGIGAALIMPAIVGLVATNFQAKERPRAYGLIAAAGAIAVALGPLIGGAATTYLSWRWVFFSESIIVAVILLLSRRIADAPVESKKPLDFIGTLLSVAGLGLAVYGVLRTSEWGWINPKADGPSIAGLSPSFWLILVGSVIVWLFFQWEHRVLAAGREPLVRADIFASRQLNGGLIMFFFQFLLQSGVFFVIPLYLSVVLELSAIDTGIRLMPLSISLLLAAVAIPKLWPMVSPRRVVRIGVTLMLLGILALLAGIDINSTAAVVALPLTLLGLGMGSLASQLGSVTVSGVSDERSGEVGGLQNTATNLGASLGTALAGSILIAVLTGSLIAGIQSNEQVPESVQQQAGVELASGVPFLSDTQLEAAMLEAGASPEVTDAVVTENQEARVQGLDAALGVLAILAMASLVFTSRIPEVQPGSSQVKPLAA